MENHIVYTSILHFYFVIQDEHTPLHRACFNGHTDVVELLIEYGRADHHRICDVRSSIVMYIYIYNTFSFIHRMEALCCTKLLIMDTVRL